MTTYQLIKTAFIEGNEEDIKSSILNFYNESGVNLKYPSNDSYFKDDNTFVFTNCNGDYLKVKYHKPTSKIIIDEMNNNRWQFVDSIEE